MSKWLSFVLLFVLLSIPFSAQAQGEISFSQVTVQLWPEYDRPEMLAIVNFQLADDVSLPTELTIRIPGAVEKPYVVAVGDTAQTVTDQGVDYSFQKNGDWLEVTLQATAPAVRVEYYDPITRDGNERSYIYNWAGDYQVDDFSMSVLVPVDTTEISTDPAMSEVTPAGSTQSFLDWQTLNVASGQALSVQIAYTKTSDRLSMSDQPVETGVVDEDTQGRVSLSNYLPYILGGTGVLLIVIAGLYFWQSGKGKPEPRKRHRSNASDDDGDDVYCSQCGKRAKAGDRFCRSCGTRLRREN